MTTTTLKSGVSCAPRHARRSFWGRFAMMMRLRRQRLTLKNLDEHMLNDIGVTRREASIEAEKPVWDVPRHWSR